MKYTFTPKSPKDIELAGVTFVEERDAVVRGHDKRTHLEIAVGKPEAMTRRKLITTVRKIVTSAKAANKKKVSFDLFDLVFPETHMTPTDLAEMIAVNLEMANFEFTKYKTKPKDGWKTLTDVVVVLSPEMSRRRLDIEKAFKKGKMLGEAVNATRALANTPGGDMTPSMLAQNAVDSAEGLPITVTIIDERGMEELGMGAILGVGKGSDDKPKFIVMEYFPLDTLVERPIVLVGKGITFDTGGLNLKPTNSIYEMHMDMSGGAAVINAIILAARMKLKKNIVALVPAAENMPSGGSYRPGDVLKSMSGKTIEVMNTDAEGRVVLADALHYAKQYKPRLVVDVATLTGAAEVALGTKASAIFTRDSELETTFRKWGEESGDYVWPLPLWDEYEDDIKGTFGDWANDGKSRYGGAIQGAMFLYQFIKEGDKDAYPWVHIDMAPRMVSTEGDFLAKGAAGEPVRLLMKVLEQF